MDSVLDNEGPHIQKSLFNNHKSWSLLIILMNCILNDIATCNLIFYFSNYVFTLLFTTLRAEISLLLAFTKSFAWLVCRVVGLFTPREKPVQQAAWDFPLSMRQINNSLL